MPQLIKPNSVKIITQDGEIQVSITLDLNINLNTGELSNLVSNQVVQKTVNEVKPNDSSSSAWEIPDFLDIPKINFGKSDQ